MVQERTFSLSEEQADFIDQKVASGAYVSGSEVIREGLRAIQGRDAAIEKWLREEVVPSYNRMAEQPDRGIPLDEAFDRIEAKLLARAKPTE
jgi:antitoxin ParD1/3/4